ncbi:MAG: hypothetical protein AAB705_03790 [Patescibacteria group bacterium]
MQPQQAQTQNAQIKCGKEGCGQVFVEVPLDNKYHPGLSMIATVLRQAHLNETGHEEIISSEPDYIAATVTIGLFGVSTVGLAYRSVITS